MLVLFSIYIFSRYKKILLGILFLNSIESNIKSTIMNLMKRILVIGAGPAGLSILKALNKLPAQQFKITCIEKQPTWSGQWNYTWRSTTDKYGQHVHSSMYSQLWTNLPKQVFQFPDYTFQEHFGKPVPSYVPREVFKGYFLKRFEREGLKKYVKFNCTARNVQFFQKQEKFQVRLCQLDTQKDCIELFDYVIVATGHYSYPNLPQLKGIELFKGKVAHCHQIRQFNELKNLNVLVIGGSYSAEDVTLQCYKFGAKKIIWAYRHMKMKYNKANIPGNIQIVTGLSHFDQENVYFTNGDKQPIDAILLCTGYIHHYPFMEEKLRLYCDSPNVLWAQGLYYNVAWEKNPKLFYAGMGSYRLSQIVVDAQGYLIRDIIWGRHSLPPDLDKKRHSKDIERHTEMKQAKTGDDLMTSGIKYIKQLMQITDYPKFDVQKFVPMYNQSIQDRENNIITFRDVRSFQSIHTGQWSCKGKRTWLEMLEVEPTNPKSKEELKKYFQF